MYYRDDYCGGSKGTYSLYAKLENSTIADMASMNDTSVKCNNTAKLYGMNTRVGNWSPSSFQNIPKLSILDKTVEKISEYYYKIKSNWQGYDKENTANLLYRYKINDGKWSNWSKNIQKNGLIKSKIFEPYITVQVKNTNGDISEETR